MLVSERRDDVVGGGGPCVCQCFLSRDFFFFFECARVEGKEHIYVCVGDGATSDIYLYIKLNNTIQTICGAARCEGWGRNTVALPVSPPETTDALIFLKRSFF